MHYRLKWITCNFMWCILCLKLKGYGIPPQNLGDLGKSIQFENDFK